MGAAAAASAAATSATERSMERCSEASVAFSAFPPQAASASSSNAVHPLIFVPSWPGIATLMRWAWLVLQLPLRSHQACCCRIGWQNLR